MSEKEYIKVDDLFKENLGSEELAYDENAWKEMEKLMVPAKKNRGFYSVFSIGLVTLALVGVGVIYHSFNKPNSNSSVIVSSISSGPLYENRSTKSIIRTTPIQQKNISSNTNYPIIKKELYTLAHEKKVYISKVDAQISEDPEQNIATGTNTDNDNMNVPQDYSKSVQQTFEVSTSVEKVNIPPIANSVNLSMTGIDTARISKRVPGIPKNFSKNPSSVGIYFSFLAPLGSLKELGYKNGIGCNIDWTSRNIINHSHLIWNFSIEGGYFYTGKEYSVDSTILNNIYATSSTRLKSSYQSRMVNISTRLGWKTQLLTPYITFGIGRRDFISKQFEEVTATKKTSEVFRGIYTVGVLNIGAGVLFHMSKNFSFDIQGNYQLGLAESYNSYIFNSANLSSRARPYRVQSTLIKTGFRYNF